MASDADTTQLLEDYDDLIAVSEIKQRLERRTAMIEEYQRERREKARSELRQKQKADRAFSRRLQGKELRSYSSRVSLVGECRDDVRRRYNREAMRTRRGKTQETVRSYECLDHLTEEQKKMRRADIRRRDRAVQRKAAAARAALKNF